jgi:hypothetical protein
MAAKLMEEQNLKEIWRCPVSGYWFSRTDYAENYSKEHQQRLEHYQK